MGCSSSTPQNGSPQQMTSTVSSNKSSVPKTPQKSSLKDMLQDIQDIRNARDGEASPRAVPSAYVFSKVTSTVAESTKYDTDVEQLTDKNVDQLLPQTPSSGAEKGKARKRRCDYADPRLRFREDVEFTSSAMVLVKSILLVGCTDYEAFIYDASDDGFEEAYVLRGPHKAGVSSVAMSSDAKLALTGSKDNKMRLFDLCSQGRLISVFDLETQVSRVLFSRDSHTMMASDGCRTIACWNIQDPTKSFKYVDKSIDPIDSALTIQNESFGRYLIFGNKQVARMTALDTVKNIGKVSSLATLLSPPIIIAGSTENDRDMRKITAVVLSGELAFEGEKWVLPQFQLRAIRRCGDGRTFVAGASSSTSLVVHVYEPDSTLIWTSAPLIVMDKIGMVNFSTEGGRLCVAHGTYCSLFHLFRADKLAVVTLWMGIARKSNTPLLHKLMARTLMFLVPVKVDVHG